MSTNSTATQVAVKAAEKGFKTEFGSAIIAAIFVVYCIGLIAYLRFAVSNDTIFGLAIRCRKKQTTMKSVKVLTWLEIVAILTPPIVIAVVWSSYLSSRTMFPKVTVLAVCLLIFFIVCLIIGFAHWQGNKWHLKRGIAAIFSLAILACLVFAFAVSVLGKTYSFSGFSAIILTVNFIPACFLVFQKTLWNDNDIRLLYEAIAKDIAKPDYKTKIAQPNYDERADLKSTLVLNFKKSGRFFKLYGAIAALFYIITLVVYLVVILAREVNQTKYIGITTPVFLLFSDLVILSLREQPVSVDGKNSVKELQITDIIYSPTFQSFVMVFVRVLLCFFPYIWLIMYSFVYLIVQIVASFDLSYAIFSTTKVLGNE